MQFDLEDFIEKKRVAFSTCEPHCGNFHIFENKLIHAADLHAMLEGKVLCDAEPQMMIKKDTGECIPVFSRHLPDGWMWLYAAAAAQETKPRSFHHCRVINQNLVGSADDCEYCAATPVWMQDVEITSCQAGRDGDCIHPLCPQNRDGEPEKSGRHCPLDHDDAQEDDK